MTIPTSVYGIFTTADTRVGRAAHEIHDIRPKPVFTNTDDEDPAWVVERLPSGGYYLCARGAPTAAMHGEVFALLVDQAQKTEWHLKPVRDGFFSIQDPHSGLLWTCPSYDKHVLVRLAPPMNDEKDQLFRFLPMN